MSNESEETLISHISALRTTLIKCLAVMAVLMPAGFFLAPYGIDYLTKHTLPPEIGQLNFFAPMEVFIIQLKLGAMIAFVIGFPYIIRQVWLFLLPALYENEKKIAGVSVILSTILFLAGMAFCFAFILPMIMKFSAGFATESLKPVFGLESFLNLSISLMLAFGLMFQIPIVVLFAVSLGLISVESLKKARPYVIVIIFILAAILTPPDVVSQLMLGVPTYLLFEAGLFFAGLISNASSR